MSSFLVRSAHPRCPLLLGLSVTSFLRNCNTLKHRDQLVDVRLGWSATYSTRSRSRIANDQLSVSKIIRSAKNSEIDWQPDERTLTWLHDRGYTLGQVELWREALVSPTAELALQHVSARSPIYLILQTLRKETRARKTFYGLILLYRTSSFRMDDSSQFYAMSVLVKRAVQLNSNFLRLLSEDIKRLPTFYSAYHFNQLLQILATNTLPSAQVFATQVFLIEQMQFRGIHLNLAGYEALLKGYAHDPVKLYNVERQMIQAGYSLNKDKRFAVTAPGLEGTELSEQKLLNLSISLREANSFPELLECIAVHQSDVSDNKVWRTILTHYRRTHEAVSLCLQFIRSERLLMTTYLAGLLLQACKSQQSLAQVNDICKTAVSLSVAFDTFLWVEYLKRIIWSGQPGEAVSIVAVEPGGHYLLDLEPALRRDARIWTATIHGLNQRVKQGHLTGQKHARYLGMMTKGLKEFDIAYTPALMWCVLEAAIYSGPRMWAKRHSCDTIVAIFQNEVDVYGNEPWKLPGNDLLWHAYMKVLLANEETMRLSDAMRQLLSTGLTPSTKVMKTFALGLWESGNIQLLEYWRKYFEEETDLSWPDSEVVFATRRALRLRYFYE